MSPVTASALAQCRFPASRIDTRAFNGFCSSKLIASEALMLLVCSARQAAVSRLECGWNTRLLLCFRAIADPNLARRVFTTEYCVCVCICASDFSG